MPDVVVLSTVKIFIQDLSRTTDPANNSIDTEGLKLWWKVVFPALLPFFIGSEILMGLGVVHFMGVFRVSGRS